MAQANVVTALRPTGVQQQVAYTATAGVITNAVSAGVNLVDISVSTDAYIAFGIAPTATAANYLLRAIDGNKTFKIAAGEKVSALQLAAGGTLFVNEMTHG